MNSKIVLLWLVYLVPILHFNYYSIQGISSYFRRVGQNDDAFILLGITLLIDIPILLLWIFFTKRAKQNRLSALNIYAIVVWILFSLFYFYVFGVVSSPGF